MSDRKLTYWYDWSICGPDGSQIIWLGKSPPPIDTKRLNDVEYLCDRITNYPDSTLMSEKVWYKIVILRQKTFKNESAAKDLKLVCKAIQGDGRAKKTQEDLNELKILIRNDIEFFKKIIQRRMQENISIDRAINAFLKKDAKEKALDRREKETKNYENVFYKYNQIYKKLSAKKLTMNEIFCFFELAAENINNPNATVDAEPDGRLLTFVKLKTWFVKASDMRIHSG